MKPRQIERLLVANRGEIAVRILRACKRRGIKTVLAVSQADEDTLGTRLADRVICIGPAPSSASYLCRETLVTAAEKTGCDALHPGYGFLAEDEGLASLCASADVAFIGPSSEMLKLFGDKVAARAAAKSAGVAISEGSPSLAHVEEALATATGLGYPVVLKAVKGGGGNGMRMARSPAELDAGFGPARAEAAAAFGDGSLYLERWVERARHVEVQVAADRAGAVIHLGDRDCSVQRRHQKLVEEAPAPALDEKFQGDIRDAAVALCREVGYDSIGTVEFLVDPARNEFYFLEVNARLQVEHGVTEMITGLDLVDIQIGSAEGRPLPYTQTEVCLRGSAIECRINAESPALGFRPSPGTILSWHPPGGPGVRVDSHCYAGYLVPPYYDSLVAKLMVHAIDRPASVRGMLCALDEFEIRGVETTASFLRQVIASDDFQAAHVWTKWLDEQFSTRALVA